MSDSPERTRDLRRMGPRKVVPGKIPINADESVQRQVRVYAYPDPKNAKRERVIARLDEANRRHRIDMPANDWCTLLDYMMEFLWGRDVEEALDAQSTGEETTQAEDAGSGAGGAGL